MEPQPARTRSGLAYSVTTLSGLTGRPEVGTGTDVFPGTAMAKA